MGLKLIKQLFNKTYEVLRKTESLSAGVTTETWSVSSEVKGLKVQTVSIESFRFGKMTPETTDMLYCAEDADILNTDRVREKGTSVEYEVNAPPKVGELGANKHMEVELKKID